MSQTENNITRLLSIDIFRGITIALMIIVNSQGDQAYSWLSHSTWNGCTFADLVFPFFIFIMGVSLAFSLSKLIEKGLLQQILMKILKRSLIIFLIGLFLNAFPYHFNFFTIRVYGVLQRIAICYFFGALLYLTTSIRIQFIIMIGLLIGYWLMMTKIPVPNYGINNLSQDGNLAAYIDRAIFSSQHLYWKTFDPEGLLSTIPAIATALLGNITGYWLLTTYSKEIKFYAMSGSGILALLLGWTWGLYFPINKSLWTSSYVLWTGGFALILLSLCYWLIEIKNRRKYLKIFEIFGLNAITAYFLHLFFLKIQAIIHIPRIDGTPGNLRTYLTEHLFGWTSIQNATLMYALCYMILWLIVLIILYRKKIFIIV